MSKYDIYITEPAENDLVEIRDYIEGVLLEPVIAEKVVNRIGDAIFTLEDMPLRNNLVADEKLATQGIRKILIENYIVFYVVNEEEKTVTILRILYCRRDWINLL